MERTLVRKPHEKEKMVVSPPAPNGKKMVTGKSPSIRANAGVRAKSMNKVENKLDKNVRSSSTSQAIKKVSQKLSSKRLDSNRGQAGQGSSKSVNYLSSTTASRAKAASTVQIHKPTTSASVNKLLTSAVVSSDLKINQRRPKSANTNKDILESADRSSSLSNRRVKGKSRSQVTLKSANNGNFGGRKTQPKLQLRDRSMSRQSYNAKEGKDIVDPDENSFSALDKTDPKTGTDADSSSSPPNRASHSSTRSSGERKGIHHVTMNKTSELRAALHRPLLTKRPGTAKSETSKGISGKKTFRPTLTREVKSKKRERKRLSTTSSPKAPSDSSSLGSTKSYKEST